MVQPIIRVAYAEDHQLVREGVISLLSGFDDVSIEIEASNGKELLEKINVSKVLPDICLLDISMPVMDGFDTLKAIKKKWSEIGVIIISAYDVEMYIMRMILDGAMGYLLKNSPPQELVKAIRTVYRNDVYYSEAVTQKYFHAVQDKTIKLPNLTDAEIKVMKKCCSDLSYAGIADELGTSLKSVEGIRDSLFKKLNVTSRVSVAMMAIQLGVIQLGQPLPDGYKKLRAK